ncbi:MAG: hypothetical protein EXQ59_01455 [Acidobacteria bacterium]|nr:hypothetical protein [Acidobacteriota bacterium]
MNLADRLRGVLAAGKAADAGRLEPSDHTTGLDVMGSRKPALAEDVLGGVRLPAGGPRCCVVERRVAADAFHGSVRVGDCATRLERSAARASLLMRQAPATLPFLFFDLETTGLSGGAGTYAFLVGFGWFGDDGGFVSRQYFLADRAGERPMLEAVTADLARAGVLVSFNGKSFDAPVLETRYLFHRLGWVGAGVPHLDVLHPARRFWRGAADDSSCSLGALERRFADVRRPNDVPGFEIPRRYFEFVRSGDARPLAGVLEHNRQDLLSLAVLTARLLHLLDEGADATPDARESLSLGHVYSSAGLEERSRSAFQRAVTLSISTGGGDEVGALRALALTERRARAYDEAAGYWQRLLNCPACPPHVMAEAFDALAVHHEHRRRDFATARTFAVRGLKQGARSAWNVAFRHRLSRLEKKLEGLSEPPLFPSSPSRPSCGSPTSEPRTSS